MDSPDALKASVASGLSGAQSAQVVHVLENYLEELERGGRPERDRLVAQHPELASVLEVYLAKLDILHRAAVGMRGPSPTQAANPPPGLPEVSRLGDFRILRELGRGGMGVVYEAEQVSLGRRVALKLLPAGVALDAKQLQRFKNEAQAAAHLHHENIVPVFAVGCDQGVHFYAMQFIEGCNLAAIIAELRGETEPQPGGPFASPGTEPSECAELGSCASAESGLRPGLPLGTSEIRECPASRGLDLSRPPYRLAHFRTIAQLGIQAAQALEHAHELGILHRDIKPANLLVDESGKLWVTDFGLARCPTAAGLTQTGDLVGTIRYMSPEQALGRRAVVDQRTDIYSLGATLYELLTLEPILPGTGREELLHQIAFADPQPPCRLAPNIPPALELIVLKAVAKAPQERYLTARELVDDLQRFLDDRPVQARPPSLGDRVVKWARRHRTVVATAAVVLVLAVMGLSASTMLILAQQQRTQEALQAKDLEHRKLVANLDLFQALEETVLWVSETRLRDPRTQRDPKTRRETQALLNKALGFFERFAEMNRANAEVRRRAGIACRRIGEIQERLGEHQLAEQAYHKAIDSLQRLVAEHPREPDFQKDLADCLNCLGGLLWSLGRSVQAEEALQLEDTFFTRLAARYPNNTQFQTDRAACRYNLCLLLQATGRSREAERLLGLEAPVLKRLVKKDPTVLEYRKQLAHNQNNLGRLFAADGRHVQAEQAYRHALAVLEPVKSAAGAGAECQECVAWAHHNLGVLLWTTGQLKQAEKSHRRAQNIWNQLIKEYPSVPDYDCGLAASLHQYGVLLADLDRSKEAAQAYQQAQARLKPLVDAYPTKPVYLNELAICLNNLGNFLKKTGQKAKAEAPYREAIVLFQKLVKQCPAVPDYHNRLGASLYNLALLVREEGKLKEARALLEQSIIHEKAAMAGTNRPVHGQWLRQQKAALAETIRQLNKATS